MAQAAAFHRGSNIGSGGIGGSAVVINRLKIVLTVGSPHPALSPRFGGEGWGEGAYACPDKYETLNKRKKKALGALREVRDLALLKKKLFQ